MGNTKLWTSMNNIKKNHIKTENLFFLNLWGRRDFYLEEYQLSISNVILRLDFRF